MFITLLDAIRSLGGEEEVLKITGNTYEGIEWVGGEPKYTKKQIQTELKKLQSRNKKYEYRTLRSQEYPSVQDQLDALYHAGLFPEEMANKIKKVKEKYPKPKSL